MATNKGGDVAANKGGETVPVVLATGGSSKMMYGGSGRGSLSEVDLQAHTWQNGNGALSFMVSGVNGVGRNSGARRHSDSTTQASASILNPAEETILTLSLIGVNLVLEMGFGCESGPGIRRALRGVG